MLGFPYLLTLCAIAYSSDSISVSSTPTESEKQEIVRKLHTTMERHPVRLVVTTRRYAWRWAATPSPVDENPWIMRMNPISKTELLSRKEIARLLAAACTPLV